MWILKGAPDLGGAPVKGFAECFSELPDPRADNALHDLTEIHGDDKK